jgi:hypothetical protein
MVVHCDLSTQEVKEPPESWFFGRVAETFFIAGIEGSDRSLLLVYDGDADYENLKDQTMEGVCEEINSRHRSYLAGGGFVFPPKTELQQSVDEGPASYRQLMILCTFLPLLSIFWMVRFWPKERTSQTIGKANDLERSLHSERFLNLGCDACGQGAHHCFRLGFDHNAGECLGS